MAPLFMKALYPASLLLCLLWSPGLRAQISTDTCCVPTVRPAIPARPAPQGVWRLTSSLGVAAQYRANASDNQAFLNAGALGTLAADYYFRQRFGLGIEAGYLSYSIRQAYTQYFDRVKVLDDLMAGPTEQLPINNTYSFHLLAGPVLSVSIFHRMTLTTALRGGVIYNDAPIGSLYAPASQRLLYRFSTNDKRLQPGGLVSVALYYPLSSDVHLGLGGAFFASPVTYSIDNLQGNTYHFSQALMAYSGFASLVYMVRPRPVRQLPVVLPSCYAPVLASAEQPTVHDPTQSDTLVFRWKSGAPIYATDEEFTFRLYSLPANKLVLERTTTGLQLSWPTNQKLPEATQFYYAIQSSRRDQAGQYCLSPVTTGIVRFVRKKVAGTSGSGAGVSSGSR